MARNLLTDFDATLLDMAEVEGIRSQNAGLAWMDHTLRAPSYSVREAVKLLKEYRGDDPEPDGYWSYTIYGSGGWNRWILRYDGGVDFSKSHSISLEATAKAEELGFRVR